MHTVSTNKQVEELEALILVTFINEPNEEQMNLNKVWENKIPRMVQEEKKNWCVGLHTVSANKQVEELEALILANFINELNEEQMNLNKVWENEANSLEIKGVQEGEKLMCWVAHCITKQTSRGSGGFDFS